MPPMHCSSPELQPAPQLATPADQRVHDTPFELSKKGSRCQNLQIAARAIACQCGRDNWCGCCNRYMPRLRLLEPLHLVGG